ncbi:hypothetical protein [Microbacterium gorillae]|uniref:hypothetical protein n=1 Tax=Microbacterium gorillae TaxID=1231063 RepID=UPI000590307C|nr:hypothetical protein [Microbacterium gorillae]
MATGRTLTAAERSERTRLRARRATGVLLLIAGVMAALSAALVGTGDSLSALVIVPAVLLAAILLAVSPDARARTPLAAGSVLAAGLLPAATLTCWLITGESSDVLLRVLQGAGAVAVLLAACTLPRPGRGRVALAVLVVLFGFGVVILSAPVGWPVAVVIGAASVSALTGILLGTLLLAPRIVHA